MPFPRFKGKIGTLVNATVFRVENRMVTVDLGKTHAQGILPQSLEDFLQLIRRSPHLNLSGVLTHFANIEEATDTRFATLQLARFQEATTRILNAGFEPEWIHSACSAAIVLYPDTHGTLVRAGISLYGLWPSAQTELAARIHRSLAAAL